MSFRSGIYPGLISLLAAGLFLMQLWRPEHQVRKHTEHLLAAIADKDWAKFGAFFDKDYRDQWENDRSLALARTHEGFRHLRSARLKVIGPSVDVSRRC